MSSVLSSRVFYSGLVSVGGSFGSGVSSLADVDGVILLEQGVVAKIAEDGVDITPVQEEIYVGGSVV